MTRNTKEVALIQIRTGKLAQMPEALNQSEFGLASDANRLFIGNPANPELDHRETFPYKNLELLTEFSNLENYYKYSYENNIYKSGEEENRVYLREALPIVVTCGQYTAPSSNKSITVNNQSITIPGNSTIYNTIDLINAQYSKTKVYATVLNGATNNVTFISLTNELNIGGDCDFLHFTQSSEYNISMPERKLDEKLDDNLHITDFGIKGDGTISSNEIFNSLVEVYRKYNDNQFYRDVYFPAGEYKFAQEHPVGPNNDLNVISPFPILSNMYVKGEGIDRTVIKAEEFGGVSLLESVDNAGVPSTGAVSSYGKAGYPNNIVIENMTFNSASSTVLCNLLSVSNVTFNNVKFIGEVGATSTLVNIQGIDANHYSSDITFNNCIFQNAQVGITISNYTKNININNCKFINIQKKSGNNATGRAVILGQDNNTNSVRGINLDTNTFESVNGDYVIWVGKSSTYVSIHQSTFDKAVIERSGSTKPYRDYDMNNVNNTRKNFIDTLDITTDEKKLLKFHFAQPQWTYINYLVNPDDGKTIFTVNGKNLIDADNGIDITLDGTKVNATVVKDGDLSVNLGNTSNIILGETNDGDMIFQSNHSYEENDRIFYHGYVWSAKETFTSGNDFDEDDWIKGVDLSYIVLKRAVELNDNMISNKSGHNDIVIKPADNTAIVVDDSEYDGDTPYEEIITEKDKALTNVAYVKKMIRDSVIKHITYEDMVNYQKTEDDQKMLLLHTFDRKTFGPDVHITNVVINVRNPFFKLYGNLDKAVNYVVPEHHPSPLYQNDEQDRRYYQGDIVKGSSGGQVYAVVMKTHDLGFDSPTNIVGNENLKVIDYHPEYADIKYVDVVGISNNETAYLTQTYSEDFSYDPSEHTISSPDIQSTNKFGYDNVSELSPTQKYGERNVLVSYADRNYVILDYFGEGVGERYMTPEQLHQVKYAYRQYDEGYVYSFDEDRNLTLAHRTVTTEDDYTPAPNVYSVNYSGGSLYLKFYDKDYNEMTRFDETKINPETGQPYISVHKNLFDNTQLNPAGDMIVRIDYVRQEV